MMLVMMMRWTLQKSNDSKNISYHVHVFFVFLHLIEMSLSEPHTLMEWHPRDL